MARITRDKALKGAKTLGFGAAGNIAGTLVGVAIADSTKLSRRPVSRVGAGAGMAAGLLYAGHRYTSNHAPEAVKATVGEKAFKRRVGTKTNGRVSRRDNPYS